MSAVVSQVFIFPLWNCTPWRGSRQHWTGYVTDKRTARLLCRGASGDTSATLWNSRTPITACTLEALHPREIFHPWSFPLKPGVEMNWLSLPSGKYGDLWSKASNYFVPCQKPNAYMQLSIQVFLILKTVFYFTADKNDSGWHMAQEGLRGYILPRASMVARKAFLPNEPPTHSSRSHFSDNLQWKWVRPDKKFCEQPPLTSLP